MISSCCRFIFYKLQYVSCRKLQKLDARKPQIFLHFCNISFVFIILKTKKLHDPILWMGLNSLKARATLLFTTKFPEIPGTHVDERLS